MSAWHLGSDESNGMKIHPPLHRCSTNESMTDLSSPYERNRRWMGICWRARRDSQGQCYPAYSIRHVKERQDRTIGGGFNGSDLHAERFLYVHANHAYMPGRERRAKQKTRTNKHKITTSISASCCDFHP